MKVIKKKTIKYDIVSLTDDEKAEIEAIEKEVQEEKEPFDPSKFKKMKEGKPLDGKK